MMGRIKILPIKKVSRELIKKYPKNFNKNFEKNKQAINELGIFKVKYVRNRVSGYISNLMKRVKN